MNDRPDLDRLVTSWLRASAPPRAQDGVLSAALDRVAGIGQSRPLGGRRFDAWVGRSPRLRWAIVAIALAAVLLGTIAGVGALLRHAPVLPSGASNGWVAFAVQGGVRGSPSEIFLVRDGIPERHLVGSEGYGAGIRAVCPTFSPDGTRLAYAEATVTPTPDATGSEPLPGHFDASDRHIVITTLDRAGSPIGTDVRIPVETGPGGDACPSWARDGQHIAFMTGGSAGPASELWVADLNGTASKLAASPAAQWASLAWGPDGTAVAAADDSGIWMVPISGGAPRLLLAASAGVSSVDFAWSPDGTRIVVAGSSARVFRVDDPGHPIELPGGTSVSWSPDGRQIAYVRDAAPTSADNSEIVTVSPAGGDVRVIATDRRVIRGLIWSPDSMRLLYVADGSGGGALMSVSIVGDSAPIALTQQPHYLEFTNSMFISWQPVFPR